MELGGLHHMTAVTTNASENVAFYTDVLGLRLVKKTVNQDDVSAYHLFYGDEVGNPGTEITFFDWPHLRVAPNHPGAGEVSTTELRVPDRAALDWWAARFQDLGVDNRGIEEMKTALTSTSPILKGSDFASPPMRAKEYRAVFRGRRALFRARWGSGVSGPSI